MSLHYETYTHPDRPPSPLPPLRTPIASRDRCLSPDVAHLLEQLNKLLAARQDELDIFIVVAAVVVVVVVVQMNI